MIAKTWNVRDQTEKDLTELLKKKYAEIESDYKLLRKISDIETAKKWLMKSGNAKALPTLSSWN